MVYHLPGSSDRSDAARWSRSVTAVAVRFVSGASGTGRKRQGRRQAWHTYEMGTSQGWHMS